MICYLDSSAVVKLYVEEAGSDIARRLVEDSHIVATSKIAYAEVRAAMARASREGTLSQSDYRRAVTAFNADWPTYFALEVSDHLLTLAGDLAEKHKLRGCDAIHFSAAVILQQKLKEPLTFACWDERLRTAACEHGFSLLP